jgi:hypothetical protein
VEGDTERLEQGSLLIGKRIGKRYEAPLRPHHQTTKRAIDAVAGKVEIETQVGPPGNALLAGPAGDGRIDGDPLPPVRP